MAVFDFSEGHRVLVVGGAGDIGAAISRGFMDMGCSVIATGVDQKALEASSLQPDDQLTLRTLDVTDNDAVAAFVGGLDRLDTLVNCAGILARFKEFEIDTFQRVLDVNLTGTFRLCNASLPLLEKSKGSIVNVASMNAFVALPFIPAYCASKGGVVMLTKSLSLAWAERGVRVNALAPGYVETAINATGPARTRRTTSASDRAFRWASGRSPTTSRAARCFLHRRPRTTSPARCWRWTAASSRAEEERTSP